MSASSASTAGARCRSGASGPSADLATHRNRRERRRAALQRHFHELLQSRNRRRRYGCSAGRWHSALASRRNVAAAGHSSRRVCLHALATAHGENVSEPVSPMPTPESSSSSASPVVSRHVREDAPSLLRGEEQRKAEIVAEACVLFEEFVESRSRPRAAFILNSARLSEPILLHGHCHQKSMGLLPPVTGAAGVAFLARRHRSRCGLLRHGGLLRLQPRALRRLAADWRAPAVPRSPEQPIRAPPSSHPDSRAGIRSSDFTGANGHASASLLKSRLAGRLNESCGALGCRPVCHRSLVALPNSTSVCLPSRWRGSSACISAASKSIRSPPDFPLSCF